MLFRGHTDNTIGTVGIRSLSTSTDTLNIRDEIEETLKEEKKQNGRRKKIDRRTSLDILNLQSKIAQLIRPKVKFWDLRSLSSLEGWTKFDGRCYQKFGPATFADAVEKCFEEEATLVDFPGDEDPDADHSRMETLNEYIAGMLPK